MKITFESYTYHKLYNIWLFVLLFTQTCNITVLLGVFVERTGYLKAHKDNHAEKTGNLKQVIVCQNSTKETNCREIRWNTWKIITK